MITRIEIQNFQSHKHTVLELSTGVNIFIGVSDSGKSAIIRALNWVFMNRPSGDAFRSTWGGDTKVTVTFDDGYAVTRLRTNSKNAYIIEKGAEEVAILQALKADVPDEVQRVLNINEINLQKQLDSPFLLSETSGKVAAFFNKLVNIEKIDIGTSKAQSWLRKISVRKAVKEEDLKKEEESLQRVTAVVELLSVDVKRWGHVTELMADALADRNALMQALEKYHVLEEEKKQVGELLKLRSITTMITQFQITMGEEQRSLKKLNNLLTQRVQLKHEKISVQRLVALQSLVDEISTSQEDVSGLENQVLQVNQLMQTVSHEQEKINEYKSIMGLSSIVALIHTHSTSVERVRGEQGDLIYFINNVRQLQQEKEQVVELTDTLRVQYIETYPETCPFCGGQVSKNKVEQIFV